MKRIPIIRRRMLPNALRFGSRLWQPSISLPRQDRRPIMDAVLGPNQIQELRTKHYNATLTKFQLVHHELGFFTIKPDKGVAPHRAGQYLTLGLGAWEARVAGTASDLKQPEDALKLIRRAYSISHPILDDQGKLLPADRDVLDFYIVLVGSSASGGPAGLTPRL